VSAADPQLTLAEATAKAIADVLSGLGITGVEVGKPAIVARGTDPLEILPIPGVISKVSYVGGVSGGNIFATSIAGANQIAAAMGAGNDQSASELSDIAQSAFSEAANQMLSSAAAATSAVLGRGVDLAAPETSVVDAIPDVLDMATPHVTRVSLTVAGETCLFVQLIPQSFVLRMSAALADNDAYADTVVLDGPTLDSGWVYRTTLRLDAEIGAARLTADEVLGLRDGAVVVLDRAVDDPVELFVNGTAYGTGRLLLDGDEWAVVIEEISATADEKGMALAEEDMPAGMENDPAGESNDESEGSD
jgi:flagellar motor switch protein FliN/FliY